MAFGAVLAGAGMALNAFGTARASRAARRQAARERAAAYVQAQSVRASGQMAGFEEQRQARLAHSRALALAAASGASASDVTATKILSGLDAEGAYRAKVRLYEAENEARLIEYEGRTRARALKDQASAYAISGAASILSAGGSMYSRYGNGGPDSAPAVSGSGIDTGYLEIYGGPPD